MSTCFEVNPDEYMKIDFCVRILLEGDGIIINENITTNHNLLAYISSVKNKIFIDMPIKVFLLIFDGKISYQIFLGEL